MTSENITSFASISIDLGNNTFLKKIGLPILLVVSLAVGAAAPFWFTGGFVSNAHLVKNDLLVGGWPGWGLGSKTLFVRKGQTIQVNLDIHEIKKGGIKIYIHETSYTDFEKYDTSLRTIRSPGKHTISHKAKKSGIYELKFEAVGVYEKKMDAFTGGKHDLKYSANWDVL